VQRELPARLASLFGRSAGGGDDVVGQAGQIGFIADPLGVGIGGVEQVLGELRGERGLFFLDFLEARLVRIWQFGTGQTEVAHLVVEDALAYRGERGVFGAVAQRAVLLEQREVLADLGVEAGDLGQHVVVGLAPIRHVEHAVQVADHAPGAAEALAGLGQRSDEALPARRLGISQPLLDQLAVFVDQCANGGFDVLRTDGVETGQSGEVEQRIGHGASVERK
jgi:hypothetical protein